MKNIKITKDSAGVLMVETTGGERFPIRPKKFFPITQPDEFIGLFVMREDGTTAKQETFLISLSEIDAISRGILEKELDLLYPFLKVTEIKSIKPHVNKLKWSAFIGKKHIVFETVHNENVNMIQPHFVLLKDTHGQRIVINTSLLSVKSKALLDSYL